MFDTLCCEFGVEMLLLISVLCAVCSVYTAAVDIVADSDAVVCELAVAVDAENIRDSRKVSVTPSPATLGFTNAPAAVAIAAEICGVWHNFLCVYIMDVKKNYNIQNNQQLNHTSRSSTLPRRRRHSLEVVRLIVLALVMFGIPVFWQEPHWSRIRNMLSQYSC